MTPRGIFQRGHDWWIRYADGTGKIRRRKVGPKGLAVRAYQRAKVEVFEHRHFPERQRREISVAEAINGYLATIAQCDTIRDRRRFGAWWTTQIGDHPLRSVTSADVQQQLATLRDRSAQTVHHYGAFLRAVFRHAIRNARPGDPPIQQPIRLPTVNNCRVRYLSKPEETCLRSNLSSSQWELVLFAMHTGLRKSEQFAVRWEWVDLSAGVIRIPAANTKTEKPHEIPLNETATRILKEAELFQVSILEEPLRGRVWEINASNFIRRTFMPAIVAAGIEDFTWHDLRHTFASRLAMAGRTTREIATLLGHSTEQMARRYAHLSPEHLRTAVRVLDQEKGGER